MRDGRAIVWDLDGTLYRGEQALAAYREALAEHLPGPRGEELRRYGWVLAHEPERVAPYRDVWNAITRAAHGLGLSYAEANAVFLEVRAAIVRGEVPVEVPRGLPRLIADLAAAGVPMGVVTNSDGASARSLLRALGFAGLARHVRGDAEKPRGFVPAVRHLFPEVLPVDVLSVGDNYMNDVAPACEAGMQAVHVRTPGAAMGPCTLTVGRLEEALGWIRAWGLAEGAEAEGEAAGMPLP